MILVSILLVNNILERDFKSDFIDLKFVLFYLKTPLTNTLQKKD